MINTLSPIIRSNELLQLLTSEKMVFIEVGNGQKSKVDFEVSHLLNAKYVDLTADLAEVHENLALGGRHPLLSLEKFSQVLTHLGISENDHVVVYNRVKASNAARLWWMLKSIGHAKVQVIDGGFQAAIKAGLETNNLSALNNKVEPYNVRSWQLPTASMKEVNEKREDDECLVIDVRDYERYIGNVEPLDLIAGHIPGALNVPFATNLDEDGNFLSADLLREKYSDLFKDTPKENIIVHCGSGVTACHTLLSIAYAGIEIPKLYVGSWSEWSRNELPMNTKENLNK
jgi:thiosulfate/3-mercaptopyruvate sulfurtransferase